MFLFFTLFFRLDYKYKIPFFLYIYERVCTNCNIFNTPSPTPLRGGAVVREKEKRRKKHEKAIKIIVAVKTTRKKKEANLNQTKAL